MTAASGALSEFPIGRHRLEGLGVVYTIEPGHWHEMCDLIDRLRAEVAEQAETLEICQDKLSTANSRVWGPCEICGTCRPNKVVCPVCGNGARGVSPIPADGLEVREIGDGT